MEYSKSDEVIDLYPLPLVSPQNFVSVPNDWLLRKSPKKTVKALPDKKGASVIEFIAHLKFFVSKSEIKDLKKLLVQLNSHTTERTKVKSVQVFCEGIHQMFFDGKKNRD